MKYPSYWTYRQKVEFLQRVILVHSYLYYVLDSPVWSDKKFDETCKELVEMQKGMYDHHIRYDTQYGYVFYDFDGTTGFDLYDRLNNNDKEMIQSLAYMVINNG